MSYRIVVDSCCDLTSSMKHDPAFIQVPLTIDVGGKLFRDDETFDQAALLWEMKRCPTAPKTACPSPAEYLDAFGDGTDDVYVVTLSALLSGSHNVAVRAKDIWTEEYPDAHIHIFNSCSASAGEVRLALEIARLAAQGLPFRQVVKETDHFISGMNTLFVLESLDNLRKNGRLSRLQSIVTGTLRLKLLMGATSEGEICKRGQALSMKQALGQMVELIRKEGRGLDAFAVISHCNCLERAFALKGALMNHAGFREVLVTETAGISTVYANDGGIVVAY